MTLEKVIAQAAKAIAESVRDVITRYEEIAFEHGVTLEELAEKAQITYQEKQERLIKNHERRIQDIRERFE